VENFKVVVLAASVSAITTVTLIVGNMYLDKNRNLRFDHSKVSVSKPYELLDAMHMFQTYSTKLYYAGVSKNDKLASWYAWKLESVVKEVKERRTVPYAYNGWDAAELALMLDTPISDLNSAIKKKDWTAFGTGFDTLMAACNACHVAAEHPFVVVKAPRDDPPPSNQSFGNMREQ
jgi:hypothetical protein